MEGLIPEFALGPRGEDAVTGAGQRRGEHQRPDQIGMHAGHALRDTAADVVPGHHNIGETQFVDEPQHAAGLGGGAVEVAHVDRMFVGTAETPQVGNDHIDGVAEQRDDSAVIVAGARPAVQ